MSDQILINNNWQQTIAFLLEKYIESSNGNFSSLDELIKNVEWQIISTKSEVYEGVSALESKIDETKIDPQLLEDLSNKIIEELKKKPEVINEVITKWVHIETTRWVFVDKKRDVQPPKKTIRHYDKKPTIVNNSGWQEMPEYPGWMIKTFLRTFYYKMIDWPEDKKLKWSDFYNATHIKYNTNPPINTWGCGC